MRRRLVLIPFSLIALAAAALQVLPGWIEDSLNQTVAHQPWPMSPQAQILHQSLVVGDLHADSTLWDRDLLQRSERGHVDIPRLRDGNVAVQVFSAVTRSPRGQNYQHNAAGGLDNITLLALVQGWPPRTWGSLRERALYQAKRLHDLAAEAPEQFQVITERGQLRQLLAQRQSGIRTVGGILGIEGAHALEGDLANIDTLYRAGFRIVGLQHFFDNALGGSLHGESAAGLTPFGERAVDALLERGMILDLAHSSEQVVRDVLARTDRPLLISHTGFHGHCPGPRNISDKLMQAVADRGGLIGVGFWEAAICDPSPKGIASAIRYGIQLVGAEHIALGSDFDGAVVAPFEAIELAALTHALIEAGVSHSHIRKVMGGNLIEFLSSALPAA